MKTAHEWSKLATIAHWPSIQKWTKHFNNMPAFLKDLALLEKKSQVKHTKCGFPNRWLVCCHFHSLSSYWPTGGQGQSSPYYRTGAFLWLLPVLPGEFWLASSIACQTGPQGDRARVSPNRPVQNRDGLQPVSGSCRVGFWLASSIACQTGPLGDRASVPHLGCAEQGLLAACLWLLLGEFWLACLQLPVWAICTAPASLLVEQRFVTGKETAAKANGYVKTRCCSVRLAHRIIIWTRLCKQTCGCGLQSFSTSILLEFSNFSCRVTTSVIASTFCFAYFTLCDLN